VSSVVEGPLAPPHAPADIFFLIPWISWANILRSKRRSKTTATLGDSGAYRQPGCTTNDNQFPIPGHFTGAQRLVPTPSAIPTAAAKEQHKEDNDQKSCGVHFALLSRTVRATAACLNSGNAQSSARQITCSSHNTMIRPSGAPSNHKIKGMLASQLNIGRTHRSLESS
jgi:hypothetical protein